MSRLRIRVRDPSEPTPRTQNERLIEANFERLINNPKVIFGVDCDGQRCGLGKWYHKNLWICPHNNLAAVRPDIAIQMHPSNEILPEDIGTGYTKKVKFICIYHTQCDGHIWETKICDRISKGVGCPACSGKGTSCECLNLKTLFPHLAKEWAEENELTPSQVTPGSNRKVLWRCLNHKTCDKHVWESKINNRTIGGNGCPYCANGASNLVCPCDTFSAKFPELALEWHEDNVKKPHEVKPGAEIMVKWRCSKHTTCDQHVWEALLYTRTGKQKGGCPFCNGSGSATRLCACNNLQALCPHLIPEWPADEEPMSSFPLSSGKRITWRCATNPKHVWKCRIAERTKRGYGCPHCSASRSYSRQCIEWLRSIALKENIVIQMALSDEGEFLIPGTKYKADGYCKETNTIYEYYGDYWHGNPNIFNPEDMNERAKKTFGELYAETLRREEIIRALGYNLVTRWETEFP